MERIHPESSNVVSFQYEGSSRTLEVEFHSGTYLYRGVHPDVYRELADAAAQKRSVGSYVAENVVGVYAHRRSK